MLTIMRKVQFLIALVIIAAVAAIFTNPDETAFKTQLKAVLKSKTQSQQTPQSGLTGLIQNKLNEWGSSMIDNTVDQGVTRTNKIFWSEFSVHPDVATTLGIPRTYIGAFGKIYGLEALLQPQTQQK
ncbi:MAG: hypothetical protein PHE53_04215 [Thermoguttaceae bacterium]|nr:hypothetical protein [Thermoguttaceae bacterium]